MYLFPNISARCYNESKPDLLVTEFNNEFIVVPKGDYIAEDSPPPGFSSSAGDNLHAVVISLDKQKCVMNDEDIDPVFMECITAPVNCSSGYSFSIWLKMKYPDDGDFMTILTTGK